MKWVKQTMYTKNRSIITNKEGWQIKKILCMSLTDTFAVFANTPLMYLDYQVGVAGIYMG